MMYEIFAFYWKWVCIVGGVTLTWELVGYSFEFFDAFRQYVNLKAKLEKLSLQVANLRGEIADGKLGPQLDDLALKFPELNSEVADLKKRLNKIADIIPHSDTTISK